METNNLYERDFYAWIMHNVKLLKFGKLSEINTDILIDELESMAKREKQELISHLIILLAHLLKLHFHGTSWNNTIVEQRMQIIEQLEMSPSLKAYLSEALEKAYPKAVQLAHKETKLAKESFPKDCPYLLEQILDDDFYPSI
jgi:uncharacterized membrane protein YidH (DUF202 family)